jgi:hypothetical protein
MPLQLIGLFLFLVPLTDLLRQSLLTTTGNIGQEELCANRYGLGGNRRFVFTINRFGHGGLLRHSGGFFGSKRSFALFGGRFVLTTRHGSFLGRSRRPLFQILGLALRHGVVCWEYWPCDKAKYLGGDWDLLHTPTLNVHSTSSQSG